MWDGRLQFRPNKADLAVFGSTLSAFVAVYAGIQQGLKVIWIKGDYEKTAIVSPSGFDSIAPEGVHYLRHLISEEEIASLSCGSFYGIQRDHYYQPFDPMLGKGIQLDIDVLKTLLKKKIEAHIFPLSETVENITQGQNTLSVYTTSGKKIITSWLIDAQGKNSTVSSQPITYLTDNLWISRTMIKENIIRNKVSFVRNLDGWTWLAYDKHGNKCVTQWKKNYSAEIEKKSFNSQWYRRKNAIEPIVTGNEPRIILTVPTFFRLDPSCGLGSTLQIKSALQAVRSISLTLKGDLNNAFGPIFQYAYQMQTTFSELTVPLAEFYRYYNFPAGLNS
jgi:hypothetical protein